MSRYLPGGRLVGGGVVGTNESLCPVGLLGGFAGGVIVAWREHVVVVLGVEHEGDAELLHVVDAGDGAGLLSGLGQGWQQHGGEDGEDGDDDEQLDQREGVSLHGGFGPFFFGHGYEWRPRTWRPTEPRVRGHQDYAAMVMTTLYQNSSRITSAGRHFFALGRRRGGAWRFFLLLAMAKRR